MTAFIDAHRERFGVEPICRVLTKHGCKIAPSTYYAAKSRPPSARAVRDAELCVEIARVFDENLGVYGADKIWTQLNREEIRVARCTVERLMGDLGISGARRGKGWTPTTTRPDETLHLSALTESRAFCSSKVALEEGSVGRLATPGWPVVGASVDELGEGLGERLVLA